MDAAGRLHQTSELESDLKRLLNDKLYSHRQYIGEYGEDIPEIRDWKWVTCEATYSF
jgi:xylulose-5-phosphate/fructose-6-phosphate phosphoketolase